MQQNIKLALQRFPSAPLLIVLTGVALIAGVAIAEQQWPYLIVLALAPLLWYFPIQTTMGLYVLLMPFEGITQLPGGTTVIWMVGLLAGGTLVAVGLLDNRVVKPPRTGVWWALFFFWSSISVLWSVEPSGALHQLATTAALIIFYLVAVSFRMTENEVKWVVRLAILGGCFAAMFAVYEYSAGINWAQGSGARLVERGSLIVGETEVNPDLFGLKLIIPISLAVAAFLAARSWWGKLMSFSALAMIVLALLLTMARSALLSLLVMIVVFFVRLRLYRRLVPVALLAAALLAAMPATFFQRIREATETGGAGRTDIWKVGFEMFKHYPLFGTGLGNFVIVYQQYAGFSPKFHGFMRGAHNTYLNILVELGILGLALFLIAIVMQVKDISQSIKRSHGSKLWLVAGEAALYSLLVYGFFVDLIWDKAFWLAGILLAFAIMRLQRTAADPLSSSASDSTV
jgi:O-antigen ligase